MTVLHEPLPPERLVAAANRALGGAASGASLLSALQRSDIDATGAARLIGASPVLASTLLRVANSAFYGLRGRVDSLPRAVATLGLEAVRGIVLAASLRHLGRQLEPSLLDGDEWLAHSVATAVAARRLAARRCGAADGDTAFVAGLLHDLGWAVFAASQPATARRCFQALAAATDRAGERPADIERAHFGLTHAECGALIAARWDLPGRIVVAIREHHGPAVGADTDAPLDHDVRLAEAAASALVRPLGCEAGWAVEPPHDGDLELLTDLAAATGELLAALHVR
jgi:putative nucleotidyltransferase with HDIG domain